MPLFLPIFVHFAVYNNIFGVILTFHAANSKHQIEKLYYFEITTQLRITLRLLDKKNPLSEKHTE